MKSLNFDRDLNIKPLENLKSHVNDFIKNDPCKYGFKEFKIMAFYSENFNKGIYEKTEPIFIRNNVFYIQVPSSYLAYEMQFREEEILLRIKEYFKEISIKKIMYKVGKK